jgi:glycosyltransferase involved in cell wall biosynthesis
MHKKLPDDQLHNKSEIVSTNEADCYSVIIPAYNEEHWLAISLPALKKAMAAVAMPGEIIVVDNNSSDGTARVAEDQSVKVIFEPINQISRARNAGAANAKSKYLIFLDADTILTVELLQLVLDKLISGTCCGGGVLVAFDHPIPWYYRWIPPLWNRLAVRFGLAAGCFVYCLREGFEEVGGFSEKVYASEEIGLSIKLGRWGKPRRLGFEVVSQPPIITSSRKMQDHPLTNFLSFCFVLVFPFAVRFRSLCRHWYK